MILNETYDEILERLDKYSINEGWFADAIKDTLSSSKIFAQFFSKIQYEITNKIENCLRCLVYEDQQIANTIDVQIVFDNLYDKKFITEASKKAKIIINPIVNEYNSKFKESNNKYFIKFKKEIKHLSIKSNTIILQYSYENYL